MAKTEIEEMLEVLLGPFQTLGDAIESMRVGFRVDDAVGAQLDVVGNLVGQGRDGRDDDTYRRFVRARIATNNSDGLVEDAITVARLVLGEDDAVIRVNRTASRDFGGAYIVRIDGVLIGTDVAVIVLRFVQAATDAGIRVFIEYQSSADEDLFSYAPFTGEVGVGEGYGSTADPDVGGVYAGAVS